MTEKHIITSESVTEGHPDKVCDQISDSILDAIFSQDSNARVAVETLVKTEFVVIAGEVTATAKVDYEKIARDTLKDIGYTSKEKGIGADSCKVLVKIKGQSPDIAQGVDESENKEQGAGDQGMMYGYASNETEELMPLPIVLAHNLTRKLAEVRKNGTLSYLRPDGKSQVSVEYENGKPKELVNVVIAAQHNPEINEETLKKDVKQHVILPVCKDYIHDEVKYYINATGKFVIGGPDGDAGVTGRKIIVDTYGGVGRHGGGAFSGKDPSKVDRSAAYMARYVAKNIVAAGLTDRCEIMLSYVIGVAHPTSINIDTFGTNKIPEEQIMKLIRKHFDLSPKAIIETLKLKRPIFKKTASYGHFGRNGEFTWEKTDLAEILKKEAGL